MAISQKRPKRKPSGGRYKKMYRKKRLNELGSLPSLTKLGKTKKIKSRGMGGHVKEKLFHAEDVNIYNPKTKKSIKAKIINIIDNPANRNYIRRNIITKGATVETDKGKAKITSRPGQHGMLNAVLVE